MLIKKEDCINMFYAISQKFNDDEVTKAVEILTNFLQSKSFTYQINSEQINLYSGSYKDDFFLKHMKYHVKNDPHFDKSKVVLFKYSSKNKNLKFTFSDGSYVVKKANEIDFYLECDGEQFFVNLL